MISNAGTRHIAQKAAPAAMILAATACVALASTTTTREAPLVSAGLKNLGNTCYLNSQLQCAFHIPRVRSILSAPNEPTIQPEEQDPASDADEECLPTLEPESICKQVLRNLFQEMEISAQSDFPVAVAPVLFCQSLGIPVMEQQDSQEFWKLLLPALELPQLVDLYQGAYEDYIIAVDGSGRERRREEPFLDLSLEVANGSLLESLKANFGTPELLSEKEGNGWRPEKGEPKVDALKGSLLRVAGLPSLLQCHLKRFQYDWQTDVMSKLNDRFSFPKELDLSGVCTDVKPEEEQSCLYDLQAVVVHAGEYGSGHYYAYVRPDIRSDDWYRFNDHDVTKVSFKDVANDSYGGRASQQAKESAKRRGLLSRVFGSMNNGSFGFGGRSSSAYMLQYVRRIDIPKLYDDEQDKR